MTLFAPSQTTDFLVGVLGPALVALVGILAARRRQAGPWRTVLVVGLVAAVLGRPRSVEPGREAHPE